MSTKERPILFSGPMVRAILAGAKTQTRRVAKVTPFATEIRPAQGAEAPRGTWVAFYREAGVACGREEGGTITRCPYGVPGDRLWVRETWCGGQHETGFQYRADWPDHDFGPGWRPSIHMPRAASRILLEVTDVRVERLQEISEADAQSEGAENGFYDGPHWEPTDDPDCAGCVDGFRILWESINGAGSWHANPWVWVVSFKRVGGEVQA
jgi:hypothetical protein